MPELSDSFINFWQPWGRPSVAAQPWSPRRGSPTKSLAYDENHSLGENGCFTQLRILKG